MVYKYFSAIIAFALLFSTPKGILAQGNVEQPIYIVQPGENLTEIAEKFHITLDELIKANNIGDVNLISAGTELVIPGLEGISGILTALPTEFGDNYHSILRKFGLSEQTFTLLNPITSPTEIYVGSTLVLPEATDKSKFENEIVSNSQDSFLTIAARTGHNFWELAIFNKFSPPFLLPGDVLFYLSDSKIESGTQFSNQITKIELNPLPIIQGHTAEVRVYTKIPVILSGNFGDKGLNFFLDENSGFYYALTGISAIANTGLVPLKLSGTFNNDENFSIEQNILLVSGGFRKEDLSVEQTTIEPDIIQSEDKQIQSILNPISQKKLWKDKFKFPVIGSLSDSTIGFTSYFGNRRSYNNGSLLGFHGGLDFLVVLQDLNIYATAPGRVVFAGPMTIRGNTTFIDHGQGVYSGYAHQSEIKVAVGDIVQTGQIIGIIGKTGRVTGPHLHWDVWVNGNQVDPFDWINNTYP
jgi:murein DD-endopeptidase MepM/ murein hydrolase activator NlpD